VGGPEGEGWKNQQEAEAWQHQSVQVSLQKKKTKNINKKEIGKYKKEN